MEKNCYFVYYVPTDVHGFSFSLRTLGERSNEAVGELLVRDADNGPNPSEDAQPTSRRDYIGQRTKVRTAIAGPSRSTIHVGGLQ